MKEKKEREKNQYFETQMKVYTKKIIETKSKQWFKKYFKCKIKDNCAIS